MEKNLKDIRWRQRFANFEKAYRQFELVRKEDTEHNPIFRAALIQTFEFLFELAWKTLKDKLEAGGLEKTLPREVLQESLQAKFIANGRIWFEMLDTRNKLAHTYDEIMSEKAEAQIRERYAAAIKELYEYLKKSL